MYTGNVLADGALLRLEALSLVSDTFSHCIQKTVKLRVKMFHKSSFGGGACICLCGEYDEQVDTAVRTCATAAGLCYSVSFEYSGCFY